MSAALKTAELSPEALAFVKAGTPKPAVASSPVVEVEMKPPTPEPSPAIESETPQSAVVTRTKTQARREVAPIPAGLVGVSLRLPAEIHHALMRASFERKMQRQEPWTQQEIVAEALSQWLRRQGGI